MNWPRRLRNLWRQSAIRLPRRDLAAVDLQPGDRLRIAAHWWRVAGRRRDTGEKNDAQDASITFELVSNSEDSGKIELKARALPGGTTRWWLIRAGRSFEIDGRWLIHFPAGREHEER